MFRIKICGLTRPDQVPLIEAAGADALGVNFYTGSKRCVSKEQAGEILAAASPETTKVGLFVNHQAAEICETFDSLRLDLIQLHGDEPPELLAELAGRPVMKAFRFDPQGMEKIAEYLAECRVYKASPRMVLLDAHTPGIYGGSGKVADWDRIVADRHLLGELPLVLAGGLTAENVGEAIARVRPHAVDTASGVEDSPGIKNEQKLTDFCEAAKAAFAHHA